jgi:Na+/H+-dicarboxylate symporter
MAGAPWAVCSCSVGLPPLTSVTAGGDAEIGFPVSLAGFAIVLTLSGYALYYSTDRFHDGAATVHEVLGSAVIVFVLAHWWRNAAFRVEP